MSTTLIPNYALRPPPAVKLKMGGFANQNSAVKICWNLALTLE